MQPSQLDQLLELFFIRCKMTVAEQAHVEAFLLGCRPIPPQFVDKEINDTLAYLKDLAATHGFTSVPALIAYFKGVSLDTQDFLHELIHKVHVEEKAHQLAHQLPARENLGKKWHLDTYVAILGSYLRETMPVLITRESFGSVFRRIFRQGFRYQSSPITSWKYYYNGRSRELSNLYLEQFADRSTGSQVCLVHHHNQVSWATPSGRSLQPAYLSRWRKTQKPSLTASSMARHRADITYYDIMQRLRQEQRIEEQEFKWKLMVWVIVTKTQRWDSCDRLLSILDWEDHADWQLEAKNRQGDKNGHSWRLADLYKMYKDLLTAKKWVILKCPPKHAWMTSDDPGFVIDLEKHESGQELSFTSNVLDAMHQDTIFYYPLSKEYCLRMQPNDVDEIRPLKPVTPIVFEHASPTEVRVVNGLTVSTRKTLVVAGDSRMLKQYQYF